MVIVYLLKNALFVFTSFFRRWYVGGFSFIYGHTLKFIHALEHKFAVRANMYFWLRPMYQDRTIVGYVFGFLFRTIKIIIGIILYGFFIICGVFIYIAWVLVPVILIDIKRYLWLCLPGHISSFHQSYEREFKRENKE